MKRFIRWTATLGLVALLSAFLTACSSSTEESNESGTGTTSGTETK